LHLGGAWTALAAWAMARAVGGTTVLRVEDIDTPRVVPGAAERIAEDLDWLGLDWDEGPGAGGEHAPYVQSLRRDRYDDALRALIAEGLTYPCDCSRAEIARVASAPHAGEELIYPGTCRNADPTRSMKRDPAIRLRVDEKSVVSFEDRVFGSRTQDVGREVGDFVLRRGDGVYAYQLVVALDDAWMRITDVVRGDDLLSSTPRQILLLRLAGLPAPRYAHLPMVVARDGERLAKRAGGGTIRALRERGVTREELLGTLARGLGLVTEGGPLTPHEIAKNLVAPEHWRRTPWRDET
jgi:glutamyl-tRNA synthetase